MKILNFTVIVLGAGAASSRSPIRAILAVAVILAICVGVATLITAEQGRANVNFDISLRLGPRRPPKLRDRE